MSKRSNKSEFILKSIKAHGIKYGYDNVVYNTCSEKVEILCHNHGIFNQTPNHHIQGKGCPKCGTERAATAIRKWDQKYFLDRAKEVHGSLYDYSNSICLGSKFKLDIICKKNNHGIFQQIPQSHIYLKTGCPKCAYERASKNQKSKPSGWRYSVWKKKGDLSKNFKGFSFYIIKCKNNNEEFYKLGKTFVGIKRRFRSVLPYDYEILVEIISGAEEISNLEDRFRKRMKSRKYTPLISFGGVTECFK